MAFRGWPAEALEFFDGLAADNSKHYWHANKATYDGVVKGPMQALLTELAPEFGEGRIFRPNRDTRFSPDKSPYKTNIAATLARGGYIELSTEGLASGCGYWHMASDQLARYRAAVAHDATGTDLDTLLATLARQGIETIAHSELKTAPKGYPRDHPRASLLRRKGLATWRRWPVEPWLGTARAKERVAAFLRASRPVQDWLDTNVGPSIEAPADG